MNKTEIIFKNMEGKLSEILNDKVLAKEWVEMHMAFIRSTRTYVDNQVGFVKSANIRSNDNSRDINQITKAFDSLQSTMNNIQCRLDMLELPLYKRIWNRIKCMNNKLKN